MLNSAKPLPHLLYYHSYGYGFSPFGFGFGMPIFGESTFAGHMGLTAVPPYPPIRRLIGPLFVQFRLWRPFQFHDAGHCCQRRVERRAQFHQRNAAWG